MYDENNNNRSNGSVMDILGNGVEYAAKNMLKVLAGILLLVAVGLGVYTIQSGSVGILSTAGKFSKEEVQPGLHLKIPFIQSVYVFDTRMHAVNYKTNRDLPDNDGIINKPYIRVMDKKNLPIGIELTVQYRPEASEASEILSGYGFQYFEKAINPVIRDIVRDVIGKYEAEKIAIDRTTIAQELKAKMDSRFQKLPFHIGEVSLRDIKLPAVVEKKIEDVQIAKQKEQELAMIEKQAERNQKIKTIEANTKKIQITTQAKADAEKKRIEADAKAYQILKEAEAKAKANKEISESITPLLVKYNIARSWDGKYPTTYLGEGGAGGLILDIGGVTK